MASFSPFRINLKSVEPVVSEEEKEGKEENKPVKDNTWEFKWLKIVKDTFKKKR